MNAEIAGCFAVRVRNKKVPRFTTDYKELMKRAAPALRSILG
jgi:hypothetical protein